MNSQKLFAIASNFALEGRVTSVTPHGSGHIHDTFRIETDRARYVLQHVNTNVFRRPDQVMENIAAVTKYLAEQLQKEGSDPQNRVLQVIPTLDGKSYFTDEEGLVWRVYVFMSGGIILEDAESPADCFACGLAFGEFQQQLSHFPARTLHETIPAFHHTPSRLRQLEEAIAADPLGRAASAKEEIDFYLSRRDFCPILEDAREAGLIPLRVTHNDTKINNCILDEATRRPLCVLDLDTVMPGYAVNDFGDSIRSGAGTLAEDAPDASGMQLDLARYEAYFRGFMQGCGQALTETEIRYLPVGAKIMTLECGMRFLADYLMGDTYFKVDHPLHNLHRTRTQMALVQSIEDNWAALAALSESVL